MDPKVKLGKEDKYGKSVGPIQYQSMVDSLVHVALGTCTDIAHDVGIVVNLNAEPTQAHLYIINCCLLSRGFSDTWKEH